MRPLETVIVALEEEPNTTSDRTKQSVFTSFNEKQQKINEFKRKIKEDISQFDTRVNGKLSLIYNTVQQHSNEYYRKVLTYT